MAYLTRESDNKPFEPINLHIETREEFDTLLALLATCTDAEVLEFLQDRVDSLAGKAAYEEVDDLKSAPYNLYSLLRDHLEDYL